jgi:integrase
MVSRRSGAMGFSTIPRLHQTWFSCNCAAGCGGYREAGDKPCSAAFFRDKFVRKWTDLRKIQDLLGHEDISTTEIYLHVAIAEHGLGVVSPLDRLVGC